MDIERICSLVAKKYLLKNDVKDEKLFLEEVKDSSYDKIFLSEYVKNEEFFLGVFLRLTTIYMLNKMEVKTTKDINKFTEKISSINLDEYKELLKEKKRNIMPIVYNSITIKTSEKYLRQKSTKTDLDDKNLSNYIDVLANFCKNNSSALKNVFKQFSDICRSLKLFDFKIFAFDGTKIKANCSKKRAFTR